MAAAKVILSSILPNHVKCRSTSVSNLVKYQTGKNEPEVVRPVVPDEKVRWENDWPEYANTVKNYESPIVSSKPVWADPPSLSGIKWNQIDNKIDRRSHHGDYKFDDKGYPLNPMGRTGLSGRGLLGKWGVNHAADPVVTRWKLDKNGKIEVDATSGKNILEFVSIRRLDTDEWAIPGGMCDPGEKISQTLKREFMEEALNSEEMTAEEKNHFKRLLGNFFNEGVEIYRGYVDDPRNTDNAWMETIAFNFHDKNGDVFRSIKLTAGDDAKHVQWMSIDSKLRLYASHKDFIRKVANLLNAHW